MPQTTLPFEGQEPRAYARQNAGTLKMAEILCDTSLLQEQEDEKEALRKIHERLSQFPPSVREKMRLKRQKVIESSLTALQQGPSITKIASDDESLAQLRSLIGAAEAEALQQMRGQAQRDRHSINEERQRTQDLESQLSRQKDEALGRESEHQSMTDRLTKSLSVAENQLRIAESSAEAERQRTQDLESQLSHQKDEALTCESKHKETTQDLARRLSLAETQLRDAQSSAKSEHQRSMSTQSQLERQKDEALARLSKYEETIASSRTQLKNRDSELLRCQSTIEEGVQRIKDLQRQLRLQEEEDLSRSAVYEEAMDGLNRRLGAVKIELQRRQATIKHDRQRSRENDTRLARHKEGYQQRLACYQQTTEDLHDMLWASQTEALRCRHTIRYGRQRLLEADRDVRRKNSSLRRLRTNLRHLRSDRRKLLARSALLRARAFHILRRLAPTLASNKRLINSLEASKSLAASQVADKDRYISALRVSKSHVQAQLKEQNKRVDNLEFELRQVKLQLSEKKSYLSVLVPSESKARSQLAEKNERIQSLESSKSLAESSLNEKDRQLETAAFQRADACGKMARYKRTIRNVKHARGELVAQRDALLAVMGAMWGTIRPHRALLRANRSIIQHLSGRQDETAVQLESSIQDMHIWVVFTIVMYGVQARRIAYLYAENDGLYDAMKSLTISLACFDRQTRELRSVVVWQGRELSYLRGRLHHAEVQRDATANEADERRNGFLKSLREVHHYYKSTIAQTKERHRIELSEQQAHHKRLISSIQYQARCRGNMSLQIAKGITFCLVQQLNEEHTAELREQERRNTDTIATLKRFEDQTNQTIEKLGTTIEELRAEVRTLKRLHKEKESKLQELETLVYGSIQGHEELAAQHEGCKGKIEELANRLEGFPDECKEKDRLNAKNAELRAEVRTLKQLHMEKESKLQELEILVYGSIQGHEEFAAQHEGCKGKIEELTNKLEELENNEVTN
ncbi:hypothetical protein KC356_g1944 [Hortaea werneckii]|nr:hypothetical protein KC356_g1944 [Hortaea werneckii]